MQLFEQIHQEQCAECVSDSLGGEDFCFHWHQKIDLVVSLTSGKFTEEEVMTSMCRMCSVSREKFRTCCCCLVLML